MSDAAVAKTPYSFTTHSSIAALAAADWDQLAGDSDPFVSHGFLTALEQSGALGQRRGWQPCHLAMRDGAGRVVGAAPLYSKSHSRGEFVFDDHWAAAYQQAIGPYYPKLQLCVPFSPVAGPRLLVGQAAQTRPALVNGVINHAQEMGVSSLHVTFLDDGDRSFFEACGLMTRTGYQFHWFNQNYGSFEDFLAVLTSRKRKAIRKERRQVAEHGLTIQTLDGPQISPADWAAFYDLYLNTVERKWAPAYLTPNFFQHLGAILGARILMIAARDDAGRLVAAALNLIGSEALYGRYWGAVQSAKFLHFELCYYQAIDYAIAHGLARVEAGAQGLHKIQRGYWPVPTYSCHWIRHPGFAAAVAQFLEAETPAVKEYIKELQQDSPYRQPPLDQATTPSAS